MQWELGNAEGGFVFINNGIEGMLRIFSDIVDHLVEHEEIVPAEETAKSLFEFSQIYLHPLVQFLEGLDLEEASELRRSYGSAGRASYWRRLQIAIREVEPDFNPPGLTEYVEQQKKEFNKSGYEMITDLEAFFNQDIRRRLEDRFGPRWFKDGVPPKVYQSAHTLAIERNQSLDPEDEVDAWDCLFLIDYCSIVQYKNEIWKDLFETLYTLPRDVGTPGGWKTKSDWFNELNRIRNLNMHNGVVTAEDHEFLTLLTTHFLIEPPVDA